MFCVLAVLKRSSERNAATTNTVTNENSDHGNDADDGGKLGSLSLAAESDLEKDDSKPSENHLEQPLHQPTGSWLLNSESRDELASTPVKNEDDDDDRERCVESVKRFKCNSCDFATCHEGHYERHVARCRHGNSESPVHCDHCQKQFVSANDLNQHLKEIHDVSITGTTSCPCCKEQFDTVAKLNSHLHDEHQKMLSCRSCNFRFVQWHNFKTNLQKLVSECRSKYR